MDKFYELGEPRQFALINMIFNLGAPRFKKFKKFIAAVDARDWETAADELVDSKWFTTHGNRVNRIKQVLLTGEV